MLEAILLVLGLAVAIALGLAIYEHAGWLVGWAVVLVLVGGVLVALAKAHEVVSNRIAEWRERRKR